jgi:hypothetical protein
MCKIPPRRAATPISTAVCPDRDKPPVPFLLVNGRVRLALYDPAHPHPIAGMRLPSDSSMLKAILRVCFDDSVRNWVDDESVSCRLLGDVSVM